MCGEPAPPNIREVLNPFVEARAPKMLRLRPAERAVREGKGDETEWRRDHGDSSRVVNYCHGGLVPWTGGPHSSGMIVGHGGVRVATPLRGWHISRPYG